MGTSIVIPITFNVIPALKCVLYAGFSTDEEYLLSKVIKGSKLLG